LHQTKPHCYRSSLLRNASISSSKSSALSPEHPEGGLLYNDLRIPPANRLELLKGGRVGQYSIRINDQWRICFCWDDGSVLDVEIVDYH
jgi:hypothetical protein